MSTTAATRYVAELTFAVDAAGTQVTHYVATSGFSTKPTDTPANTYVAPRLKSAGSYRRELFSGSRVTGVVRPSFGELVILNNDGGLDAWLSYGVSGGKVVVRVGDEGAAYPAGYTTVFIAYAQHMVVDFSEIRVRLRDRLNLLEQPLLKESFAGSGGLEGTTGMAGKLKQWVSSDPYGHPVILVNPSINLYYVQSTNTGGLKSLFQLFEGGVELVRDTDYTSAADCIATAPTAAGRCRFWFGTGDAGPVYVRTHSAPNYDLRVSSFGYAPTGGAWTVTSLAAIAGIASGTGSVPIGPVLVDDSRTYLQVMESSCASSMSYFGLTRLDVLFSGSLSSPSATASYSFTQYNARGWSRQPVQDMDAPVWSVTVNSGKRWPSNLQSTASATSRDYLTRTPWWASFSRTTAAVKTANPGAVAVVVNTDARAYQSTTDQNNFLNNYMALFGVSRDFYTFTAPLTAETLALELHDTVEIKLPRFGLSAGKKMRVITQQFDCDNREIIFGVWG